MRIFTFYVFEYPETTLWSEIPVKVNFLFRAWKLQLWKICNNKWTVRATNNSNDKSTIVQQIKINEKRNGITLSPVIISTAFCSNTAVMNAPMRWVPTWKWKSFRSDSRCSARWAFLDCSWTAPPYRSWWFSLKVNENWIEAVTVGFKWYKYENFAFVFSQRIWTVVRTNFSSNERL